MRSGLRSDRGFTIVEMMIAVGIMMAVTGAIFTILNPAQGTFQAQPEVSDMQQRLRVGVDSLQKDIVMAGGGAYQGSTTGALYNMFAPIMPYRLGGDPDHPTNDIISLIYVPSTPAQTSITTSMPPNSAELKVEDMEQCTAKNDQLCGFKTGMRLLIYDTKGHWDTFTVTQVQGPAGHLQHQGQDLNYAFGTDSAITQAMTQTYYLKSDAATNTYQLMYFDGYQTDTPVVDNVVKLEFLYFGDPLPPRLLPKACFTAECKGSQTTYGPTPPALGTPNAPWPDGENCAFTVADGVHTPRLATLDAIASQVSLPLTSFNDGPWCPSDSTADRFDADLLRIRRVRVKLRVQAALASLRGPAGTLFVRGGTASSAERFIPDQEIQFDVAPRNMNLGR